MKQLELPPQQSIKRKLLFQRLAASTAKSLPEIADAIGLSSQLVSSYNARRGPQPSENAIRKALDLVDQHVNEVIALARSMEAINPLSKDEFFQRFRTNASTVVETGRRTRIRLPARVGSIGDLRIIHDENRLVDLATERAPYAFKIYRNLVIHAGPPLIDGEPLPTNERQRVKGLLALFVRGLNITRQQLADLVDVQLTTVSSWLNPNFPVTPKPIVLDLLRPYSIWAVDTRDALDRGDLTFPPPKLNPNDLLHWQRFEPQDEVPKRLPSLDARIRAKKGN